jgi:nicotinamide phosphoribosyltransferase
MTNLILNTDSYKASHFLQYPPGTKYVSSYIEARGVARDCPIPNVYELEMVNFGLQMFLQEYLSKPITKADIDEAEEVFLAHGEPFNREGWEHILDVHNGFLPLYIQALPEGMIFQTGIPQVQVMNTDPTVPWLTSYIETALLRAVWYPSSVATISREMKKLIYAHLKLTADDPAGQIPFKLHDFGARGVSSLESAGIGGVAHLVNFLGTDTVTGLMYARKYYGERMAGFSIPAAEHSTITSWGEENEARAYENMVTKFGKPGSLVAVVSDSYDIFNAADKIWGQELKEKVLASGATVVVRPDSGDPVNVNLRLIDILGERFGSTVNQKGYKVLNPSVRIIQGDGVNFDSVDKILSNLRANGWSAENIAFGMGGALLQKVNRDTFKYAMKANAISDGSGWKDVFKDPVTDRGKQSKRGRQKVVMSANGLLRAERLDVWTQQSDLLELVYSGSIAKTWKLQEIRDRAKVS